MREPNYYEEYGEQHDRVMRCNDCKRLILHAALMTRGGCPRCGCRRVVEVMALSFFEWLRIRIGLLRFPHWREFLAEFSR